MRRVLKLLLLLGIGLAFAKPGPPPNRPGGNGDGGKPRPPTTTSKVDADQGTESASKAVQAEAEAGRGGGSTERQPESTPAPTTEPSHPDKWSSQTNLDNHYRDHGEEMGYDSQIEYAEAAKDLTSTEGGRREGVQIKRDGNVSYFFDPATGEFAASGKNGVITYFKPDDPADYFRRQPGTEV
jgi:hypothetical protein